MSHATVAMSPAVQSLLTTMMPAVAVGAAGFAVTAGAIAAARKLRCDFETAKIEFEDRCRQEEAAEMGVAVLPFTMNVLGIAGQMVMTILDGAMGSRINATNPAFTWAIVGACAGITPALWSLPTFRRRRAPVLLVPGWAMLILCVLGLASWNAGNTKTILHTPGAACQYSMINYPTIC